MGKIEFTDVPHPAAVAGRSTSDTVLYVAAGRAARLAQELLDQGLRPDTPVALVLKRAFANPSDTNLAGYGDAWFR